MDILIISHFCDDFSTVNNDRFLYIANLLKQEHNVEVVTSDFFHTKKEKRKIPKTDFGFKVTLLHEPGYNKNVCLKRFFSHFVWGNNVKRYLNKRNKPDVIYSAVPSLTAAKAAAKFCHKNNVRFVIDIQDLWPEAFQMVFNVPIISNLFFLPFNLIANKIYKLADSICAVSETYVKRGLSVNTKAQNGVPVFLGTNLKSFDDNAKTATSFINRTKKKRLAYCGTLGSSYNLLIVFDALKLLKTQGKAIPQFIIMGSGPRFEEFSTYADKLQLDVIFTGRLPYNEMCSTLASCNMAVNPITNGAAQSIINKHADYAAAGIPVINTQQCDEYSILVKTYNMGINCDTTEEVANAIEKMMMDDNLRRKMGDNARKCAEDKFDRCVTYRCLIAEILKK